ncbi:MAG: polysaccharide biosynthesis tyrosine autokinase, partial [Rikenellaceae bacterium]|nr:polysaccharide biosynthesis tyrosine autokinase [Rikenellaceae bacterium]
FLGADLLRNLINEYNIDAIADKNATAHATALFIEERLKDITQELNEVEEQAENYRKANSFTDLTTQGGVYLNQREGYDRTLTELETQLNLLRFIDRYLADNARRLIPAVKILNSGLHEMIGDYNKLVVEYNRVESGASAENPVASQLKKQLETYRNNILASVKTEIKTTRIQIGDLKKELASTDDKIRRIPTIDREYTDIMRQREVKATLFSFLLQKREEINLTQAGVVPKARTIASPYSSGQVSPRKSMVFIMFFMLAMLVPSAALYLTYLLRTRIRDISDLDALHGPTVVGDIARAVEGDFCDPASCMVVASDCDSVITEMFRTMRNNLLFMLGSCERNHDRGNGCNVVLVTSTIPKEGKTFISINLARMLSLMDKKVLLIGADLRNPQLAYALNIVKSERGLSSWLAGMVASVDELLVEYAPNMSILQAGPIPPNPNELLSGPRMRELFDMLHGRFDYVVVDSAPVGVVSDTFVISQYADAVVYVMRENYTQKDAIPFVNNLVSDGRLHGVAVALNATGVSGKMSRYKYGATRYGYKSSYRYRYEYVGAGSGGKGGRKKR